MSRETNRHLENVLKMINYDVLVKLIDCKDKEKNSQGFQVKRSNNLRKSEELHCHQAS